MRERLHLVVLLLRVHEECQLATSCSVPTHHSLIFGLVKPQGIAACCVAHRRRLSLHRRCRGMMSVDWARAQSLKRVKGEAKVFVVEADGRSCGAHGEEGIQDGRGGAVIVIRDCCQRFLVVRVGWDRVEGREAGEPVDGRLGLADEPVDCLAGAVEAKTVLDVVELDGGVGREADAAVPGALGRVHLAVAILPPCPRAEDVATAPDLDCLSSSGGLHCFHPMVHGVEEGYLRAPSVRL